ncbi:MAG: hypothetical protein KBA95_01720 [Acidobacteria bacterium]|nr:hypothetical protein [Acidobacteriota bacterium]
MSDTQVLVWCAFVVVAAAVAFGWGYVIGRDSGRRPGADRAPLLVHQALVAQVRDYLPVHAELGGE